MTMSPQSLRACEQYALEVGYVSPGARVPSEIATLRNVCREAWTRGFEGSPLRVATSGPAHLAWAAGQRFPGAVPYTAPDACASVPKAQDQGSVPKVCEARQNVPRLRGTTRALVSESEERFESATRAVIALILWAGLIAWMIFG